MTELKQVMTLIDNNSSNIQEGDYLQICNLLMEIHKNIPDSSRVPVNRRLDFREAFVLDDQTTHMIRRLERSKWVRMTERRKLDALCQLVQIDNPHMTYYIENWAELSLSEIEGILRDTHGLTNQDLKRYYEMHKNGINCDINSDIRSLRYGF